MFAVGLAMMAVSAWLITRKQRTSSRERDAALAIGLTGAALMLTGYLVLAQPRVAYFLLAFLGMVAGLMFPVWMYALGKLLHWDRNH